MKFYEQDFEEIMKRDLDLIRNLMLKLEARDDKPSWQEVIPDDVSKEEQEKQLAHIKFIKEAGLINAIEQPTKGIVLYYEIDLTNDGHDFIAISKSTEIWNVLIQSKFLSLRALLDAGNSSLTKKLLEKISELKTS